MKSLFTFVVTTLVMNSAWATDTLRSFERIDCSSRGDGVSFNAVLDPTPFANTYFEVVKASFVDNFESGRMVCQGTGEVSGYSCVGLTSGDRVKKVVISQNINGELTASVNARRGQLTLACTQKPCTVSFQDPSAPWRTVDCR